MVCSPRVSLLLTQIRARSRGREFEPRDVKLEGSPLSIATGSSLRLFSILDGLLARTLEQSCYPSRIDAALSEGGGCHESLVLDELPSVVQRPFEPGE